MTEEKELTPEEKAKKLDSLLSNMNPWKLEALKKKHNLPHDTSLMRCFDNYGLQRKYLQAEIYIDANKSDKVKNRLREMGILR